MIVASNGALDPGPRPLELPIGVPTGPAARRRSADDERPARPSRTRIEIDLVTDDDIRRDVDNDGDDALHSHVIEIDLA
jgi:hypothetical protein